MIQPMAQQMQLPKLQKWSRRPTTHTALRRTMAPGHLKPPKVTTQDGKDSEPHKPLTTGTNTTWPTAYPLTWGRLAKGGVKAGTKELSLDPIDTGAQNAALAGWKAGDQIVISGVNTQFTDDAQGIGMPRIWMDADEEADRTEPRGGV